MLPINHCTNVYFKRNYADFGDINIAKSIEYQILADTLAIKLK